MKELKAAVSNGYARGKFEPVPRDRIGMTDLESGYGRSDLLCRVALRCR
jgi:hypothetical protein